jgi:hypothetical protein
MKQKLTTRDQKLETRNQKPMSLGLAVEVLNTHPYEAATKSAGVN